MKILFENSTNFSEEEMLKIATNSVSGCNIRVGEKVYKIYTAHDSFLVAEEVKPDFELSEEEFKALLKR